MAAAGASSLQDVAKPRHRCESACRTLITLTLITLTAEMAIEDAAAAKAGTLPEISSSMPQAWLMEASADLDARVASTLQQIHGIDRQMLALRAYLRAGDDLTQRWSWTAEQLANYPNTPEGKAAAADIDAVISVFARSNPGYTLHVNRMPRSLTEQLAHWNENDSVRKVAGQLVVALRRQFPDDSRPTADKLRHALIDWKPSVAAPLAAPGLSAHGQGRAFDFEVQRDGHAVAGFEASAAHRQWDAQGWTQKLHSAVVASGKPLTGPLQSPYEPWHYAYNPGR
jgi:hypothetical protein